MKINKKKKKKKIVKRDDIDKIRSKGTVARVCRNSWQESIEATRSLITIKREMFASSLCPDICTCVTLSGLED